MDTSSWQPFYAYVASCQPRFFFKLVAWQFPMQGMLKLNTDGCSLGNPGMSGVLQDAFGEIAFLFE